MIQLPRISRRNQKKQVGAVETALDKMFVWKCFLIAMQSAVLGDHFTSFDVGPSPDLANELAGRSWASVSSSLHM